MDVTEPTSDLHLGFSGEASAVELAHLGAARCRLEQGAEGWARLGVQGRLPRGWSVRLTGGLARRGVSLVAGHARRHAGDAWRIELELDLGHADASSIDFLGLARGGDPGVPGPAPRILDFELFAQGETLHLEVHAWDGVGLLAAVLERVWGAGLRPDELLLETEGECAFHSLVLRDEHRAPPTALHARRLDRALRRLVRE